MSLMLCSTSALTLMMLSRRNDHLVRRLFARKISVKADSIDERPGKQHQTNMHNAKQHRANGNVIVTVRKQYLNTNDNPDRPKPGSVFFGDSAVISSRVTDHILPARGRSKRFEGVFSDNVIVDIFDSKKDKLDYGYHKGRKRKD